MSLTGLAPALLISGLVPLVAIYGVIDEELGRTAHTQTLSTSSINTTAVVNFRAILLGRLVKIVERFLDLVYSL